ncbi:hypothetical protein [Phenylobacterium sp.]|uniref:hypothetical protein n=1 Tax=Phenylobacterium sp. TaxID=1871053 RepID=UPI001214ABF1|nr:hypothetical protein [Phenylobacterium sp.]THD60102.1 MAG: hypothetical protein E8A49_14990 [Phenylobacterium sp.]
MQDVWIVDQSGTRTTREVYADLRWFDPKTGPWPAVFFDPEHASVARFTSEPAAADRIVMHSPDLGTADSRRRKDLAASVAVPHDPARPTFRKFEMSGPD